MAETNSGGSGDFKGLAGPQGIRITAARSIPDITAPTFKVAPSYLGRQSIDLKGPRLAAYGVKITPGGVLKGLPSAVFTVAANKAIGFDADADGKLDSFYLDSATYEKVTPLSLFGVVADGVKIEVKELSNHPQLLQRLGLTAPQWVGSIALSGRSLTLPNVPSLTVTPLAQGQSGFIGRYSLASGDLAFDLKKVSYSTKLFSLSMANSTLSLLNSSKALELRGSGEITLPTLPFGTLRGDLDLRFKNNSLDQLDTSLSWTNTASKSLTIGGFALTPLQATLALAYRSKSFKNPGRSLQFKDGQFQLAFGDQKVRFSGDVKLNVSSEGLPSFQEASLKLDSDVSVNLGGFNLKLLANDPQAPTKFSLFNQNGTLVPSLSGKIEFTDLSGLALTVPEGGIRYGANGWELNDVSLGLGSNLELGPIRLGSNAFARYQQGMLTVDPDLSINLDTFNQGLRPLGQLIADVVTPVTAPVVTVFKTDLDLGSTDIAKKAFALVKDKLDLDLAGTWTSLVQYIEAVPGNPYKDGKLILGELLDFVGFQAYDLVRKNPQTANQLFKETFGAELPSWLLNLPQSIEYQDLSMSATIDRFDKINQLASSLQQANSTDGQWTPLPLQFQLSAKSTQANLNGGESAKQALQNKLSALSSQLRQLDAQNPVQAPAAVKDLKALPLSVGSTFEVPLITDPISTLLSLIGGKRFDVVRNNFTLGTGLELNYALPLAPLVAAVPGVQAIAPALQAAGASFKFKAALGAQAALTLGLSSTASELGSVASAIANRTATPSELAKLFAGKDPISGQALGLYVGQTGTTPMLQIAPSVQVGLGVQRLGVSADVYSRADGKINLTLTSQDGSNRAYLTDVLTGLASLPGIKVDGSLRGTIGADTTPSLFGPAEYKFDIIKNASLLDLKPRSQALMLASSPLDLLPAGVAPPLV